jgi:hypothetical protein
MDTLTTIPTELLLEIMSYLPALSQYRLISTCRFFRFMLIGDKGRFSILLAITKSQQDGQHILRVCSKCNRIKPFHHFSHRQASSLIHAKSRRCLECHKGSGSCNWLFKSLLGNCEVCHAVGLFVAKKCELHGGCSVFAIIRLLDERLKNNRNGLARGEQRPWARKIGGGMTALRDYLAGIRIDAADLLPVCTPLVNQPLKEQ